VVIGEQVSGKAGREWLAAVRADLETDGYACGCADLPACAVGAPHIRQRLWWCAVADADAARPQGRYFRSGAECADQRLPWEDSIVIPCADGKARLAQSAIFPLAYDREWGSGSRVGILRAAGNAIVPALAAEFIRAVMDCIDY
jgi:DNA (cytosine-5)-methyltransferase 1